MTPSRAPQKSRALPSIAASEAAICCVALLAHRRPMAASRTSAAEDKPPGAATPSAVISPLGQCRSPPLAPRVQLALPRLRLQCDHDDEHQMRILPVVCHTLF